MNFSSFVSVIVLILNIKFKVSLLSFLFMLLFWSSQVNLWCLFCFKTVSAPQGWGVSENLHNQIFLISTHFHFSLYFHHILFHPFLPPSITLPFPPFIPGCCCDWLSNVSIFYFVFCFLTNIVFLFLVLNVITLKAFLERTLYGQLLSPVQSFFNLNCINAILLIHEAKLLRKTVTLFVLAQLYVIVLVHMFW